MKVDFACPDVAKTEPLARWTSAGQNRKSSPSEQVHFPREGDCTGQVQQRFSMVLEGYTFCRLYTEKLGTRRP
jgi:hypothetical protein